MTETEFVRFVAKSKKEIIYFIANYKKIKIWSLKTAIFNLHLLKGLNHMRCELTSPSVNCY